MLEYITSHLWLLWLIIAVVCLLVELTSFDFFVTCFAVGALCAMCVTFFGFPWWAQILVWAVFSTISVFVLRPALTKRLHSTGEHRESNADALIGKEGKVIETIEAGGHGYVKIDGDEWRSVSADGQTIEEGTHVRVVARESIIMTVVPV